MATNGQSAATEDERRRPVGLGWALLLAAALALGVVGTGRAGLTATSHERCLVDGRLTADLRACGTGPLGEPVAKRHR